VPRTRKGTHTRRYPGRSAAIRLGINNGRAEGLNNVVRLILPKATHLGSYSWRVRRPAEASSASGYADRRADHLARLREVEGQVRGIARMVEEDR
jgi:hypothetical protein